MTKIKKPKKRTRRNSNLIELGMALDFMLAGHNNFIGTDFLMTHTDPLHADIGHLNPLDLQNFDQPFIDTLVALTAEKPMPQLNVSSSLLAEYQQQRVQLCDYQQNISEKIFSYDIIAAKELGNFDSYIHKVVLRNEAEMNVFYDYIALYRKLNGKRTIAQLCLDMPEHINDKNKAVVTAFSNAKFSLLKIDKNLDHGGIKVTNVFKNQECLLMDKALNASKKEGLFFICSLLDMGKYSMTSGGGIPIDPQSNAGKSALSLIKKYLEQIQKSRSIINVSILQCAKEIYGFCLRGGALKYMTVQ